MTREQLLAPITGEPFSPFEIHTKSGNVYTVSHPEPYWVSPQGETVRVYLADQIALIGGDHVAEFVRLVNPGQSPGRSEV